MGLDDYAVSLPGLLVPSGASRSAEAEDLTALHAALPSVLPRQPSLPDPQHWLASAQPRLQDRRGGAGGQARPALRAQLPTGFDQSWSAIGELLLLPHPGGSRWHGPLRQLYHICMTQDNEVRAAAFGSEVEHHTWSYSNLSEMRERLRAVADAVTSVSLLRARSSS